MELPFAVRGHTNIHLNTACPWQQFLSPGYSREFKDLQGHLPSASSTKACMLCKIDESDWKTHPPSLSIMACHA